MRVLMMDDSNVFAAPLRAALSQRGGELHEAQDVDQAASALKEMDCQLVVLHASLPGADGVKALGRLRGQGIKTPALIVTSDARSSVVAEAMKLGIEDYVLKPLKPEALVQKVFTALKLGSADASARKESSVDQNPTLPSSPAKGAFDVLVIDDMENVAKKLRTVFPPKVTMEGVLTWKAANDACRKSTYRLILIDTDMPEGECHVLAAQLRVLQPQASFVALAIRKGPDRTPELKKRGFSDVLFKPFPPDTMTDFLQQHFEKTDLLSVNENVVTVAFPPGAADRMERQYGRLLALFPPALESVVAGCFDDIVLDITALPPQPDKLPKLLLWVTDKAQGMGLSLKVVAGAEVGKLLTKFEETKSITVYASSEEARASTMSREVSDDRREALAAN